MSLLTAEWLKTPAHAASFFISLPIALFLHRPAVPKMPRLLKTAELTRWQLVALDDLHAQCLTRVHNVSTLIHRIASRILLDAKVNNGTSYFNKGLLTVKESEKTKEPEE